MFNVLGSCWGFQFFFSHLIGPGSQFKFLTFQSVKDLDLIGQVHMAITTKRNVWTSSSIIVQSITKIGQMTKEASIPIYPHLLHFCFKVQQGPFVGHISAHCSLAIHLIYLQLQWSLSKPESCINRKSQCRKSNLC